MKTKYQLLRITYIIGIIAFLIGVLDPLEGSVVIALGSLLISVSTFILKDKHWKIFLATFAMILIGVVFMFYLSSLGGFGGTSNLSWWWGILILPYPIGWIISVVLLIIRLVKRKSDSQNNEQLI